MALPAAADSVTTFSFDTVPPGGSIVAAPGQTAGWGYSFTNQDTTGNNGNGEWLYITGVNASTSVQHGTLDSSVFDFPTIAPGQTLTVPWNLNSSGLYQLTWDSSAPSGSSQSGLVSVTAEWYFEDPAAGDCNYDDSGNSACFDMAPYESSAVTIFTANVAPEPGSGTLWALGAIMLLGAVLIRPLGRLRTRH